MVQWKEPENQRKHQQCLDTWVSTPRYSSGRLHKKGWTSLRLFLLICKMQEIDWIGQGDFCSSLAAKSFILFLITFRVEPQYPQADKK